MRQRRIMIYVVAILTIVAIFATQRNRALDDDALSFKIYIPLLTNGEPREVTLPKTPVGVQMLTSHTTSVNQIRAYNAGARWVHIYFSWSTLEYVNTTPENFNWKLFDPILENLSARGFQVIVNIDNNPSWAASNTRGPLYPGMMSEFEQFLRAMAERYSKPPYNLHHYQFYLEPDSWTAWGGYGAEYATMLEHAHRAIHSVDPDGKVILGGLAHENWEGCNPSPCFDMSFLRDIVNAGGAPYIDIMNFHYYDGFRERWSPKNPIGKAKALRNMLPLEHQKKPFICTEIGEVHWQEGEDMYATRERQARFIVEAYAHVMGSDAHGIHIEACTWFSFENYNFSPTLKFGLLDELGAPLPAYYALQTFTTHIPSRPIESTLVHTPEGIEGYRYLLSDNSEVFVLWNDNGSGTIYNVPANQVQVTSLYGNTEDIGDGDPTRDRDGQINSHVGVHVGVDPVIIRIAS